MSITNLGLSDQATATVKRNPNILTVNFPAPKITGNLYVRHYKTVNERLERTETKGEYYVENTVTAGGVNNVSRRLSGLLTSENVVGTFPHNTGTGAGYLPPNAIKIDTAGTNTALEAGNSGTTPVGGGSGTEFNTAGTGVLVDTSVKDSATHSGNTWSIQCTRDPMIAPAQPMSNNSTYSFYLINSSSVSASANGTCNAVLALADVAITSNVAVNDGLQITWQGNVTNLKDAGNQLAAAIFVNSSTATGGSHTSVLNTGSTLGTDINDANAVFRPTAARGQGAANRHFEIAVSDSRDNTTHVLTGTPVVHTGTGAYDVGDTTFNYTWPYGTGQEWPGAGYQYVQLQVATGYNSAGVTPIAVGDLGSSGIPAAGHRTQVTWNFVGTGN